MNARYMLDTNICIYIAKAQPKSVLNKFEALEVGAVTMSAITFGELAFGVEKSQHPKKNRQILDKIVALIPAISLNDKTAIAYGKLRAALQKKSTPIGNNNLWIAAHALSTNLTLVTNHSKEFERVPNLKIENWVG